MSLGHDLRCVDVPAFDKTGGDYSEDMTCRWSFERRWSDGPLICWIGLNPGTGDSDGKPRPTLRRMIWWSERLAGGAVLVVNLFAYRTTHPAELRLARARGVDIVGSRNDAAIDAAVSRADKTVLAWGYRGSLGNRGREVAGRVSDPLCLGVTANGQPRHPLYVPLDSNLIPYPSHVT